MTVETYDLSKAITVTQAAANYFKSQLKHSGKAAVRISLKESGCTGFMYVLEEVDQSNTGDIEKHLDNDVTVYVSPEHLAALQGTEIDLTQQGLNKNVVFNNPNVKDACGCGESFSV